MSTSANPHGGEIKEEIPMNKIKTLAWFLALALLLSTPAAAYDGAAAGHTRTMSGGGAESFVIDGGGTLWAWGDNMFGQLGDGTTQERTFPVKVLEHVRSVSAGESHTYAVLEDNTLWAWGRNVSDAFPDSPDLTGSVEPVKIMDDVSEASTGVCTHLAVKTDGTLWAWGRYVGNRTNKQYSTPQKILDNVSTACTGFGHSLALKKDGALWAWGQNNDGEVGDGSGRERLTPVKVLDNVVSMSAGYGFSAAVKADGSLWTWGRNWQGELGDGTTWIWGPNWDWHSSDPEEDALLQDTLAAWVEMWGSWANRDHSVPTQVLDKVAGVYTANNNTYALRTDGSLWGWGSNVCGAVGDGTTEDRLFPVPVLDQVSDVAVGWDHVLACRTDGSLWTWGSNLNGQLGNGDSGFTQYFEGKFSPSPTRVMGGLDTASPYLGAHGPEDAPSGWALETVNRAIAKGFVPDSLQGRYSQAITRAEFCALAVRFYEAYTGQEIDSRTAFTDTDDVNVEKAAALGVVSGIGDGSFHPDAPLNREQAAVILTNLARIIGSPLPQAAPAFADSGAISGWARSAVGQVQAAGVMNGVGGSAFAPQDTYTREQSVATIMNLYHFLEA